MKISDQHVEAALDTYFAAQIAFHNRQGTGIDRVRAAMGEKMLAPMRAGIRAVLENAFATLPKLQA